MTVPLWFQVVTFAVVGGLLLLDLAVVARRPHAPSMRESALWVICYVFLALVFAAALWWVSDAPTAGSFVGGWLTEYSLSVDNLFVFVLIMSQFAVPRQNQQKVLMLGIILSLLLRGSCILVGAAAIERFSWVFYVFGGFLIYTAIRLARESSPGEGEEYHETVLVRRARRILPITERYDGAHVVTRVNGRRMLTPMIIVFLAIGSTDLLFALDSIPAVFGLTQDPFVVFTATLFALMGLRQLFFLLGGLLDRLVYLSNGLAIILGFIGVKLVLDAVHDNELPFINGGRPVTAAPDLSIGLSLGVIVVVLVITTVASLLHARAEERAEAVDTPSPARAEGAQPAVSPAAGHGPAEARPTEPRPAAPRPEDGRVVEARPVPVRRVPVRSPSTAPPSRPGRGGAVPSSRPATGPRAARD